MGSSPQTQKYKAEMNFGIPASFLSHNDVLNALNSIPGSVFDSGLAGVLTLDNFLNRNLDVKSLSVGGSHWAISSEDNTKAVLVSTITTVSDPLTAADLAAIFVALAALIVSAILFIFGPGGWVIDVIILALAAIGVLTLVAVTITEITAGIHEIGSSPILSGALLLVGGGVAVAGAGYLLKSGASRRIYSGARRGLAAIYGG